MCTTHLTLTKLDAQRPETISADSWVTDRGPRYYLEQNYMPRDRKHN
jgi:hypothetical protein